MERLLTTKETSEILRISMSKLYKLTALNEIPHVKIGSSGICQDRFRQVMKDFHQAA